ITNKTAAEIIADRADHNKPHMGLTTWKTAPDGKIISTDVVIAKNYLLQEEISELNNIVSMFLDQIKDWLSLQPRHFPISYLLYS
ncbi:MAG: RhuM family protein, partial [Veillonella sp.]|nr:RhuM family protein [Veillonella sp.]